MMGELYKLKGDMTNFIKRNLLFIIAAFGIILAIIYTNLKGADPDIPYVNLNKPPESPFEHSIAGIGFVEASSRNISIGSHDPGIVSVVSVEEGEIVKQGDILFILDQRSAIAELERLKEEIDVAHSSLELARVELADREDKLKRAKSLDLGKTISEEEVRSRYFAVQKAKADINVKQNILERAEKDLARAKVMLDKTEIKSPIDGMILKVRIMPGEFINGSEDESNSPILIGKYYPLHLRVQVDESDIWRFDKTKRAIGFLRSNNTMNIPLSFLRLEPYAKSKENLKGKGTELVDTRIIEIIYKIDTDIDKLFIGQQLDVFIESDQSP